MENFTVITIFIKNQDFTKYLSCESQLVIQQISFFVENCISHILKEISKF